MAEYLSFIETIISTRKATNGNINLQKGGRGAPQRPPPPNRGPPATTAMCTQCKSDRLGKHTREQRKAPQCSNCSQYFYTAAKCRRKPWPRGQQLNTISKPIHEQQLVPGQDLPSGQPMTADVINAINPIRSGGGAVTAPPSGKRAY